jgi:AraC-like DNA-binding protein
MVSAIKNTNRLDSQLLKQISRMYENGISIKEISQELGIDEPTTKKLLKMLGYMAAD